MKLIREQIEDVQFITEASENGAKSYFIEGIFMSGDKPNKNKRRYPGEILEREANRYTKELIETRRAFGELGHPAGPGINLDRVSHIITELKRSGSDFRGKAKITDTPMGAIARGIMESGGCLGVSTRGLGSVKIGSDGISEVQKDFYLATAADIVADPSAHDAFVQGIMEGVEYYWDNGAIKAQQVAEEAVLEVEAAVRSHTLNEGAKLRIFNRYLKTLL